MARSVGEVDEETSEKVDLTYDKKKLGIHRNVQYPLRDEAHRAPWH